MRFRGRLGNEATREVLYRCTLYVSWEPEMRRHWCMAKGSERESCTS